MKVGVYLPPRPKKKVSITSVVAFVSFLLLIGGMCVARSPAVNEDPRGLLIDATMHVRDSNDEVPMIFYWVGTVVAAGFIVGYVLTMGTRNPYAKRRHKAD